jgi:hypothetical protein
MYTNECVLMMYYNVTGIVVVGHDGFELCKIGLLQLDEICKGEYRRILCLGCRTVDCAVLFI